MTNTKTYEAVTVDGMEIYRTYRGYDLEIEVYTKRVGNLVYSLYQKPNDREWHCDWTTSYNCQPVILDADATNKDAMLKAFVAVLKTLDETGKPITSH